MDKSPLLIFGPCSVEGELQIEEECAFVAGLGLAYIRGGCFKPRTKPGTFQGLGWEGVNILHAAAQRHGLQTVSEVTDVRNVERMRQEIDVLQVGARNMQNYDLLREIGRVGGKVLLKRGLAATLDEWFGAAEHILKSGPADVWLCERGHRSYMPHVRFMLDIAGIVEAKRLGFCVLADPSHAAGRRDLVSPLALAALSAGADGIIVEIQADPDRALSDSSQQLDHMAGTALVSMIRGDIK